MTCIALWFENESNKIPMTMSSTFFGRDPRKMLALLEKASKVSVNHTESLRNVYPNGYRKMTVHVLTFKDGSWLEVTTPHNISEVYQTDMFFNGMEFFAFWK